MYSSCRNRFVSVSHPEHPAPDLVVDWQLFYWTWRKNSSTPQTVSCCVYILTQTQDFLSLITSILLLQLGSVIIYVLGSCYRNMQHTNSCDGGGPVVDVFCAHVLNGVGINSLRRHLTFATKFYLKQMQINITHQCRAIQSNGLFIEM